jgi:arylsulfatase A-like enzyme
MHLHQPLPENKRTFVHALTETGYYTVAAGKWHLGQAAVSAFNKVLKPTEPSGAGAWLEVLKTRPRDQPFFFWFAALDPHRPYEEDTPAVHTPEDAQIPPYMIDTPATRQELIDYYDEVARLDGYVGGVVAELDRQGVLENTLILFLSDNGRPFHRAKTSLYDSGIRTPLIAVWPGHIAPGSQTQALISSIDIAPTLLQVAGAAALADRPGQSFLNAFENPDWPGRTYVFAEHNWHGRDAHERAVRTRDFLFIQNQWPEFGYCHRSQYAYLRSFKDLQTAYNQGLLPKSLETCFDNPRAMEELYAVDTDPYSLVNLIEADGYRETADELRGVLNQWRTQTSDTDWKPHQP